MGLEQTAERYVRKTIDFSTAEEYFRLDLFFQLVSPETIVNIVLKDNETCPSGPLLSISGAHDATGMTLLFARESIDYGDILLLCSEVPIAGRLSGKVVLRMPEGTLEVAGDEKFVTWCERVVQDLAESEVVSLAEVMAAVRQAENTLVPATTNDEPIHLPPATRSEIQTALRDRDLAALLSAFLQARHLADKAAPDRPLGDDDPSPEELHVSEIGRCLVELIDRANDLDVAIAIVSSLVNKGADPVSVTFLGVTPKGRARQTVDVLDRLLEAVEKGAGWTPLGTVAKEQRLRRRSNRQQRRSTLGRLETALGLHKRNG